jgi:uncharacterized protein (TIGR02118 family)
MSRSMIKVVAPAIKHPRNRSLADFQRYWAESHGPLFAKTKHLRRYVQHLTLPEAYGGSPPPTYDGDSMFWFDDLDALRNPDQSPEAVALREAVFADDRQLFDREPGWPLHHKSASVAASEHVVVDGATTPEMVKIIFVGARMPGLTLAQFFDHWRNVHGPIVAELPGLRRYVQNHVLPESYALRGTTHDGWAELWFDDLAALRRAQASPAWAAAGEDGLSFFAQPIGIGVARELVQKGEGCTRVEPDFASWSEGEIRTRLEKEGYVSLLADADAPGRIKAAAQAGALAVWTAEHLVTIDSSRIDARPER